MRRTWNKRDHLINGGRRRLAVLIVNKMEEEMMEEGEEKGKGKDKAEEVR